MKVTFKTLQQKAIDLEVDESLTILQVKELLADVENCSTDQQKLIYKGKVLADETVFSTLEYNSKEFIVLMVTKPKAATPAKPAPAPTPAPAPVAAPVATPAPAAATPAAPATTDATFDASTLATGTQLETAIANMVEMGFPRDQVLLAMRAAFNNPDRAVEYLMTGIPDNIQPPAANPAPQTPAAGTTPTNQPAGNRPVNLFQQAQEQMRAQQSANPPAPNAELEALRDNPQFRQLQQLVRNQPEMLQPILQQIAESNPELIPLITNNQDQFLQMLQEGGPAGVPGENMITITPEEDEAIKRLTSLGFDRNLAIEAYLACDKNEEMAANYLFDMNQEDFN